MTIDELTDHSQAAEARGRRRGHQEAADHLDRVAAEWTAIESGAAVARALRMEARFIRRMYLGDCTRANDRER